MQEINNTQYFKVEKGPELRVSDVLAIVYRALMEKGYNPVNQIVGYIISARARESASSSVSGSGVSVYGNATVVCKASGRRQSPGKGRLLSLYIVS